MPQSVTAFNALTTRSCYQCTCVSIAVVVCVYAWVAIDWSSQDTLWHASAQFARILIWLGKMWMASCCDHSLHIFRALHFHHSKYSEQVYFSRSENAWLRWLHYFAGICLSLLLAVVLSLRGNSLCICFAYCWIVFDFCFVCFVSSFPLCEYLLFIALLLLLLILYAGK